MSDVFVLGAGFSIAAARPMHFPNADQLGRDAVSVQKSIHSSPHRTHSSTCDGLSCDNPQLDATGRWPSPTFEQWLSVLAEPQPWLNPQENDRNRALFGDLVSALSFQLSANTGTVLQGPPPQWLNDLVRQWLELGSRVVTFNYDVLVEATVEAIHGRGSSLGLRSPVPHRGLGATPLRMSYAKLHGSLHWRWDDSTMSADSIEAITLNGGWNATSGEQNRTPWSAATVKSPFIIPPMSAKSPFYTNLIVRRLWRQGFESIRSGDRVIVIGYSFPPEDLTAVAMIRRALTDRGGQLVLVNPDPSLPERSERILGTTPSEVFDGDDCVERFVGEWTR